MNKKTEWRVVETHIVGREWIDHSMYDLIVKVNVKLAILRQDLLWCNKFNVNVRYEPDKKNLSSFLVNKFAVTYIVI